MVWKKVTKINPDGSEVKDVYTATDALASTLDESDFGVVDEIGGGRWIVKEVDA